MIKHFCDICGAELKKDNMFDIDFIAEKKSRLIDGKKITLGVEFILHKDKTSNDGEFCKYCVFDAVAAHDDRLTAA